MIHAPEGPTSQALVKKIADLVEQLEEIVAQPHEVTREDDFALAEALNHLRQVVDSNPAPEQQTGGVRVNAEQQVFVIPAGGGGYSCFGFDNLFKELGQLAKRLGLPAPQREEIGTLAQYGQYQEALELARRRGGFADTWFHEETPREIREALEQVRESRTKVRVYLGDRVTGQSWMEEFETIGRIGRSTGLMKIPLLVPDDEDGGPALLDHCIVRIQNARTGRDLYRHPSFHVPPMRIQDGAESEYPVAVEVEGKGIAAQFKNHAGAERWMSFMNGERMSTR